MPWSPKWKIPERTIAPDEEEVKYSDADLANELNQLTFEEREAVTEDIHGLSGVIPENPPFVREKLKEFREVMDNLSANVVTRAAWDRAVFLRPSLQSDRELALLYLRAKRFDTFDAVQLLFKSYEAKQFLFGEESVLHRRIRWDDLTELEQSIVRSGFCLHIPRNKENTRKEICVTRIHGYTRPWTLNSLLRATVYEMYWGFECDPYLQRKGRTLVVDARGTIEVTPLERIQFNRDGIPVMLA